jgi:nicotinate-nucleotide adenylyltransferase
VRIGVFGGTFDPPHLGHLIAAADAYAALALDRVLFVPAAVQPLKLDRVRTSARCRLEMVRAAVAADERFAVDELELRRTGPSYTADTLEELSTRFERAELFLLVGADVTVDLVRWYRPERILELATLAVLDRGGDAVHELPGARVVRVPVTRIDISATEIRRRAACGESIRYLVPDAVREIIRREGLYT